MRGTERVGVNFQPTRISNIDFDFTPRVVGLNLERDSISNPKLDVLDEC